MWHGTGYTITVAKNKITILTWCCISDIVVSASGYLLAYLRYGRFFLFVWQEIHLGFQVLGMKWNEKWGRPPPTTRMHSSRMVTDHRFTVVWRVRGWVGGCGCFVIGEGGCGCLVGGGVWMPGQRGCRCLVGHAWLEGVLMPDRGCGYLVRGGVDVTHPPLYNPSPLSGQNDRRL